MYKKEVSRTIQNLERQEEIDDLRFTIESAPVLQKLLLDELRNFIGNQRVIENEWKPDPESTSIEAELEEIRPRVYWGGQQNFERFAFGVAKVETYFRDVETAFAEFDWEARQKPAGVVY